MSFLPSFCGKDFSLDKKFTTISLELYYLYLFLAFEASTFLSFVHCSFLAQKTPQAVVAKFVGTTGVIDALRNHCCRVCSNNFVDSVILQKKAIHNQKLLLEAVFDGSSNDFFEHLTIRK